jgi:hypothetical protein
VLVLAPAFILWGIFLLWAAWTDVGGFSSNWYEEYRGSKIGFWKVSGGDKGFRGWFILAGALFAIAGIAGLVWAL